MQRTESTKKLVLNRETLKNLAAKTTPGAPLRGGSYSGCLSCSYLHACTHTGV
jgi:hypothetical protein